MYKSQYGGESVTRED